LRNTAVCVKDTLKCGSRRCSAVKGTKTTTEKEIKEGEGKNQEGNNTKINMRLN
jgi:hypothetical protein